MSLSLALREGIARKVSPNTAPRDLVTATLNDL